MQDNQNQALSTDLSKTTMPPDQALKMITDLWGAMIALFGVRWSSQFGETPDATGQWRQTLSGISRQQVAEALNDIRNSGRAWPPTAPEFRAMCLSAGKEKHPPLEAAYSEINQLVKSGRKDYGHVSPILYHTINKNLDFYNFKIVEEWKAFKMFEVAYKATLFQIESGEELKRPQAPETMIESATQRRPETPESVKKGEAVLNDLLSMFDPPKEPKPLTENDIKDFEKLERVKCL